MNFLTPLPKLDGSARDTAWCHEHRALDSVADVNMYVRWPKQVECIRVESVRVCLCLGSHHEVVRNANIVVEKGLAAIPGMLHLEDLERTPD